MTKNELQNLFYHEIPISEKMGVEVLKVSDNDLQLLVSLNLNKNHKGTAFGGSQYSACALACYGLFLSSILEFGHNTNNIVIANGSIKYISPVTENFIIEVSWDTDLKNHFFKILNEKKKAKVNLTAHILEQNSKDLKSVFNGEFVAFL